MRLWKMNGAGNVLAIFDARAGPFNPTPEHVQTIAETMQADQVMAIFDDQRSNAFVRIWNRDGSEVEACGNGTRAIAFLLMEESGNDAATIRTKAGFLKGYRAENGLIRIDMGTPVTHWADIPLTEAMDINGVDVKIGPIDKPYLYRPAVVNIGNPHAVFFVDNIDDYDVAAIGPLIEWHPVFPQGTNVGLARIIDRETIRLRVWERGAGLTKACGTGACAALVCAARTGRSARQARLILDGGALLINWDETSNRVMMTGPVSVEQTFTDPACAGITLPT